jgi:hypothetical protein
MNQNRNVFDSVLTHQIECGQCATEIKNKRSKPKKRSSSWNSNSERQSVERQSDLIPNTTKDGREYSCYREVVQALVRSRELPPSYLAFMSDPTSPNTEINIMNRINTNADVGTEFSDSKIRGHKQESPFGSWSAQGMFHRLFMISVQ